MVKQFQIGDVVQVDKLRKRMETKPWIITEIFFVPGVGKVCYGVFFNGKMKKPENMKTLRSCHVSKEIKLLIDVLIV